MRTSYTIAAVGCILILAAIMMAGCTGTSGTSVIPASADASPAATAVPAAPGIVPAAPATTVSPAGTTNSTGGPVLTANTLYVNSTSNGKIVTIPSGDRVLVRLKENPTTGFVWNATVPKGISVISDIYVAPDTGLVGAPGYHEWILEPETVDTYTFTADYRRPWEKSGPAAETFQLVIQVTKE